MTAQCGYCRGHVAGTTFRQATWRLARHVVEHHPEDLIAPWALAFLRQHKLLRQGRCEVCNNDLKDADPAEDD